MTGRFHSSFVNRQSSIRFVKMVGTGNDFILLDLRRQRLHDPLPKLARRLCQQPDGVGADGLLTIEPSARADVKMRIFNPDGSEAEMCGNGARCVALAAADGRRRTIAVETKAGILHAQTVGSHRVRVTIPQPSPIRLHRLTVLNRPRTLYAINTGVPHAVLFVPDIRRANVPQLGPVLRHHRAFRPAGTNVDFVHIASDRTLKLRTYERGVEAETLACGTGAVAAALVAAGLGRVKSPVVITPKSGERLVVRFSASEVSLEGEVHRIFEGRLAR